MPGCNRTVIFDFEGFEGKTFEDMPKGEFMRMAANPYTGAVVMTFNDNWRYIEVVESILMQLGAEVRRCAKASGGYGLVGFADECDGTVERMDARPQVVKMVREGVYTQRVFLEMTA